MFEIPAFTPGFFFVMLRCRVRRGPANLRSKPGYFQVLIAVPFNSQSAFFHSFFFFFKPVMQMKKLLLMLLAGLFIVSGLQAQSRSVSGRVTDDKGNPVANATVT